MMRSNGLDFAILHLHDLLRQLVLVLVVEGAGVVLGHAVPVAEEQSAAALHAQQLQFAIASRTFVLVYFRLLLHFFLLFLRGVELSSRQGSLLFLLGGHQSLVSE